MKRHKFESTQDDLYECVHCGHPSDAPIHIRMNMTEDVAASKATAAGLMTPEQESHLAAIKHEFALAVDTKYRTGQREHGGNLFDLSLDQLISNAIDEAVDQFVYLTTIRAKARQVVSIPIVQEPVQMMASADELCHAVIKDAEGHERRCMLKRGHPGDHWSPSDGTMFTFYWPEPQRPTHPEQHVCAVCRRPLSLDTVKWEPTNEWLCVQHRIQTVAAGRSITNESYPTIKHQ